LLESKAGESKMGYDKSQAERDIHDWNEWTKWMNIEWLTKLQDNELIDRSGDRATDNEWQIKGGIGYIRVF